jgi:hypothetical protein
MVAVATATKFRGVNTVFFSVEIFQVKIGHVWMTTSVIASKIHYFSMMGGISETCVEPAVT